MRISTTALIAIACCLAPVAFAQSEDLYTSATFSDAPFDEAVKASKKAMVSNPERALLQARAAENAAHSVPDKLAKAMWLQAEAMTRLGDAGDALPVLSIAQKLNQDPLLAGDLLLTRARALVALGRMGQGLAAYQQAYAVFTEANEGRKQALSLHGIARLYQIANRWDPALTYYARAREAYMADKTLRYMASNNTAKILLEQGRYAEAVTALDDNLVSAEKIGSPYFLAIAHGLLAETHARLGASEEAARHLAAAKRYDGEDSAALWRPFVLYVEAFLAAREGAPGADALFASLFDGYDWDAPNLAMRAAHEAAYAHYKATGRPAEALRHHEAYKAIADEANGTAARNNMDLLNAEFEAAARTLEIERIERARLEESVAAAQAETRLRTLLAIAILVGGLAVSTLFVVYLRAMSRKRAELSRTNDELVAASKAKDRFLANISHEIRTPLNAIIGFCEIIATKRQVETDVRQMVETMWTSGRDLLAIVNDVLDLARMEEGAMPVSLAPADVSHSVEQVAALHRPTAQAKGVALTVEVAPDLPAYVTDDHRVRQAVHNLVANAVKFTPAGRVTVRARALPSGFEVSVADTGVGISPDQLSRVFEAFGQAEGQDRGRFGGTGLGLALVRNVASLLGGDVTAQSVVGEGSVFTLRIAAEPVARAEPEADARRGVPRTAAGDIDLSRLRILYAEDNEVNVMVMRGMIGSTVGRIDAAADGAIAVDMVKRSAYDVILMDHQMPNMDGAEATVAIRALPGMGDVPIIGCTASAGADVKAQLIEGGMDDVVDKPVSTEVLLRALRRALGAEDEQESEEAAVAAQT